MKCWILEYIEIETGARYREYGFSKYITNRMSDIISETDSDSSQKYEIILLVESAPFCWSALKKAFQHKKLLKYFEKRG